MKKHKQNTNQTKERAWTKPLRALFIGLIGLTPLIFWTRTDDTYDLPKMTLFGILVVLTGAITLLRSYQEKQWPKIKWHPYHAGVLGLLGIGVITTFLSINPQVSFWGMYRFYFGGLLALLLCGGLYALVLMNKELDWKGFVFPALVISGTIAAVYSLSQFAGWEWFSRVPSRQFGRVYSTFGNPNYLGAFLAMAVPACAVLIMKANTPKTKGIYGVMMGVLVAALVVSFSRGAWVAGVSGLFVIAVLSGRKILLEHKKALLVFGSLILIAGVSVLFVNSGSNKGFSSQLKGELTSIVDPENKSNVARVSGWVSALKILKDNPVLGTGLDTFGQAFPKYKSLDYVHNAGETMTHVYAHNEFLQMGATTGLVGLAFYGFVWIGFLIIATRRWKTAETNDDRLFWTGVLGSSIALLVQNQFGFSVIPTTICFWIFAALAVAGAPIKKENSGEETASPFLAKWKAPLQALTVIAVVPFLLFFVTPFRADVSYKSALGDIKGGDYKLAEEKLEKAILLNPRVDEYRLTLGNMYKGMAQNAQSERRRRRYLAKAEKAFEENANRFPDRPDGYNNMGILYMWKAQFLKEDTTGLAIANFLKATEKDPYFVTAYDNLGRVHGWMKQYEESVSYYQKGLEISPQNQKILFNLGYVHAQFNRFNEAKAVWEKLVEINPEHQNAKANLLGLSRTNGVNGGIIQ